MTILEAVNLILSAAGMEEAGTLDEESGSTWCAKARKILAREDLATQSEDWHFNVRRDVELSPNPSQIYLPEDSIINIDSYGQDAWRDVCKEGDHLFDIDENTTTFTTSIRVKYTVRYDFDCIPEPIAYYIAWRAALLFYNKLPANLRNWMQLRTINEQLVAAKGRAKQFNSKATNANMLTTGDALSFKGDRVRRNDTLGGGSGFVQP